MEKTTLYLPVDLLGKLREASRRTGRPQAELMREALRTYLDQQTRPTLRSVGAGSDPDLHGEETEDWLRTNWRPS